MIINQTERAIVECVRERTREELAKRVPSIDNIDHRRLIYLLIEDRIAMYDAADFGKEVRNKLHSFISTTRQYTSVPSVQHCNVERVA